MCCGSVQHIVVNTRDSFMKKLQELLEGDYEGFESLDNVEKLSYLLAVGEEVRWIAYNNNYYY